MPPPRRVGNTSGQILSPSSACRGPLKKASSQLTASSPSGTSRSLPPLPTTLTSPRVRLICSWRNPTSSDTRRPVAFARARAQLDDLLRSEQEIAVLADNVLSQLCGDLKFPVGTLFILEEGILTRVGKYAFPADSAISDQFRLGEGLVGQAALEKRTISVRDFPPGGITISSGLGQVPPAGLLIVPMVYNEQVSGVLEFGLLTDEVEKEKDFLESVIESIAIAFSTAQDRNRIDHLLTESQRQAEAFKIREEELRAANEELKEQAKAVRSGRTRA